MCVTALGRSDGSVEVDNLLSPGGKMLLSSESLPSTRLFTVDEYCQMSNLGILSPEERTELIDGEIVLMAAKNPPHVISTKLCYDYLMVLLKDKAVVRCQEPIHLSDHSLPEPDISVVCPPLEQYLERHPARDEIFLVIEVSDATLNYDLKRKSKLYAGANIQEYWVIDVIAQEVHVLTLPRNQAYAVQALYDKNGVVKPDAFTEIEVVFKEFFP
ncbi:MAG: Uma2 family endonuclease [Chroococcidiopsidaceae cyanobacterium CP_BM_RX_35]|nr:Uma2 family endonuclease [Chroococcidiopsidaceae cyanobacterium CP_BM_RX_35]